MSSDKALHSVRAVLGLNDLKSLQKVARSELALLSKDAKINEIATQVWGDHWVDLPVRDFNKQWLATQIDNLAVRVQALSYHIDSESLTMQEPAPSEFVLVLEHATCSAPPQLQ